MSDAAVDTERTATATPRVRVGLAALDNVTLPEAVTRIEALIAARRPALVVTPNVDHIVRMRKDRAFAELVAGADLVLADGQPVVWASRLLRSPLKARVAGSDLFPALCARAAEAGFRVFFFGGAPGAAEAAQAVLEARHPQLEVTGTYCPPMGFERDPAERARALAAVKAAPAELVFVGLGSPKQERWIVENMHDYGPAVSIGIGISFSFVAGHVQRAPRWLQKCGLEWLHRLCSEPRRLWRRYLVDDPAFVGIVARQMLAGSR